jgi:hypothetical protein
MVWSKYTVVTVAWLRGRDLHMNVFSGTAGRLRPARPGAVIDTC